LMMYPDSFKNEPSKRTPWIILEQGRIFIMGRSIVENPGDLYRPVLEWVSKYAQDSFEMTNIEFGFEYINTSSTKWIYALLKELSKIKKLEKNLRITWYYEQGDDDLCELGFILKSLIECPFVIVELNEINRSVCEKIFAGSV
jgi:hypothetical protein